MRKRDVAVWVGGACWCGLSAISFAAEATLTHEQMVEELKALRAEIAQIKAEKNENWLSERRAEEIKSLIRDVLADADTRASLSKSGMTAGHNKYFFLTNEEGTFLLQFRARTHLRYIANFRQDAGTGAGTDDDEFGFQIRRFKPRFTGFVANPKITYNIVLAANRDTSALGLEEISLGYKMLDELQFVAGRFKIPFLREELTSSGKQLAVDRTYVTELFTMGYSEGVMLVWDVSPVVRLSSMFSDGQNQGEIGVTADFHNDNSDYALTARADVKLAGDWKQLEDYSHWSGDPWSLLVGGAVHYQSQETPNNGLNNEFLAYTVDGSIKWEGFTLSGAFMAKKIYYDGNPVLAAPNNRDHDQYGAMAQVAYMLVPNRIEPFFRYEWFDGDGAYPATGATVTPLVVGHRDTAQIMTMGVNYYLAKQNAKFTLDVVYARDPLQVAQPGLGILGDAVNRDSQVVVRGQFQLEF